VPDRAESIATIHRAIDLGVTFFDTAEVYGPHDNELLLGAAIAGRRQQLVIATKFGFRYDASGRQAIGVDSTPENIRRACDGSLRRLGIDCIDLYYQHRVDPSVPIEDSMGAMADLVRAGKVRYLGLSEAAPETLRRAARVHPIAALQSEYSLWEREVEQDILPLCRELGIGFVPYSPLGRGFLTGRYQRFEDLPEGDYRRSNPRFAGAAFDANLGILRAVEAIAGELGVSPAQVALAWLLARGNDIVPIPGAKRRVTMEDSMAAAALKLSPAIVAALDAAAPIGATVGDRYGAASMQMVRR
jgi:aryl-alcohol dehydrogenase-like predicted oxidoreductase